MTRRHKATLNLVDRIVNELSICDLRRGELARRLNETSGAIGNALEYLADVNRIRIAERGGGRLGHLYSLVRDSPRSIKKVRRAERPRTHSGSGVIAGPIEIGRGWRWGAG